MFIWSLGPRVQAERGSLAKCSLFLFSRVLPVLQGYVEWPESCQYGFGKLCAQTMLPINSLSLSICICIYICIRMYVYAHVHVHVYNTYTNTRICICIRLGICTCTCICICIYLSSYPAVYLSIYVSIDPPIHLSICLRLYLPNLLSIYLPICPSVCLSACLLVYLSLSLSLSVTIYGSICLSISLCAKNSMYLSISLPVCLSMCLSLRLIAVSLSLDKEQHNLRSRALAYLPSTRASQLERAWRQTALNRTVLPQIWPSMPLNTPLAFVKLLYFGMHRKLEIKRSQHAPSRDPLRKAFGMHLIQ